MIERILILDAGEQGEEIDVLDLPSDLTNPSVELLRSDGNTAIMTAPLREARETFEREYLKIQINRFSGNISRTAAFIGMERSALHRKLKSLGLTGENGKA